MSDEGRPAGLAALMTGLVDYAGLFPPAGLGMAEAAARYRRYRESAGAWALGRFVVPISRLDELARVATSLPPESADAAPWPLTVLAQGSGGAGVAQGSSLDDFERVTRFNEAHARADSAWRAEIRSVEMKVASAEEIERAAGCVPPGMEAYLEVPGDVGIEEMCRAAAAADHALKIRTGGTTIDAFPPSAVVARILAACAGARVPFKATAGLHHAVRAPHPVTYEPGAPRATMHGFLNVFVAACLLLAGKADVGLATRVLEDEVAGSFRFSDDGIGYRELSLSVADVVAARRFARSFGSCSFEEPLSDL
jgi:hypothetical protein